MKRQTLYEIIRSHYDGDEIKFAKASRELARDLNDIGEKKLSREITKIIRANSKVVLSSSNDIDNFIFSKELENTITILENALREKLVQKIYLHGKPGTGKTVFSEIIARKINAPIEKIRLSQIIDSRLGESMKLLEEIFKGKERKIIFVDEVDSIASTRNQNNDVFEISRVLNHFLQLLDNLNHNKIVIVATNLVKQIDSAFIRRFDISINFDSYEKADIERVFLTYSEKFNLHEFNLYHNKLKDLIMSTYQLWTPAYIRRVIQTSRIWLSSNQRPTQQITEILRLSGLGESRKTVRANLNRHGTSKSTIKYFLGA